MNIKLIALIASILVIQLVKASEKVEIIESKGGAASDAEIVVIDDQSQSAAAKEQRKEYKKFLESFKISFNEKNGKLSPLNNVTVSTKPKPMKPSEKKLEHLAEEVFGGETKYKQKRVRIDKEGKRIKYYKDYSVPILFNRTIHPGFKKLPRLNFEFKENGRDCRCSCKV